MEGRRNSYIFSTLSSTSNAQMGKLKAEEAAEEFVEEEIWAVLHNHSGISLGIVNNNNNNNNNRRGRENTPPLSAPRRLSAASRMIPRSDCTHPDPIEDGIPLWRPLSAPMNIPDWSQIQRKQQALHLRIVHDQDEQMEDQDDSQMVPPHQVITRQLVRSQLTSFSMCEGAGRTLKGRDLSRVRNAVLTRTGFLE